MHLQSSHAWGTSVELDMWAGCAQQTWLQNHKPGAVVGPASWIRKKRSNIIVQAANALPHEDCWDKHLV